MGVDNRRRDVTLKPGVVNIITGASGTGKSTLIKAIDYCLGSSKCELPAHVRRRATAVGVKWVSGRQEMIIGRIIPPVGQGTSLKMFTSSGRDLTLPDSIDDFEGATTVSAAKAFVERAFGIGDLGDSDDETGNSRGRATIRHVTPYLFVTKEVIYSESTLLHGLEKADKARDIVATMPYFLRATDEASAQAGRRLKQLQRALEREETRARAKAAADSALKQRATTLLSEANRIGMASAPSPTASESELLTELEAVSSTQLEAISYPSEGELGELHSRRREILTKLTAARRQLRATRTTIEETSGFEGAVNRQYEKLQLSDHLNLSGDGHTCPICEAPTERGAETARAIEKSLEKIRSESAAIERVQPKLIEYDEGLTRDISRLNTQLRGIDNDIKAWLRQTDDTRQLADLAQVRSHLLGRVSQFLETSVDQDRVVTRDLSVLRSEIEELSGQVDREAIEVRLRRAEAKISKYASAAFRKLPTVAPCVGSELDFSSKRPEVTIIEAETEAVLRIPDVGSDQNYLAIHIALLFAMQRFFEEVEAPVPGLLVLDQISRPYFPESGDETDEEEIEGGEEDEDVQAMRQHIDFLFAETARRKGLQVLLIEHAYFADDLRYVAATRQRWTRKSKDALIPLDWPSRQDD